MSLFRASVHKLNRIMIEHENFDSTQASSGNINGWQVKTSRQQNQTETQSPSLEQVYPSNEEDK